MARSKASSDSAAASEVFLCEYSTHVSPCSQTNTVEPRLLARFTFADTLRTESDDLITTLRSLGLQIHLLSGDHELAVAAVASRLGIDKMQFSAAPAAKRHYVQALQRTGAIVLMIGDGINDAPVLAAADVSIAVGSATSLARTAADVISLQPGIRGIALLLYKARHTQRIIRQNLLWAALYNLIAIPAAAMGFIPPWAAAIGMAVSSLLVAGNAIRLWAPKAGGLAALPMAAQRKTETI
jgi:Cu2+-exporting ATPase